MFFFANSINLFSFDIYFTALVWWLNEAGIQFNAVKWIDPRLNEILYPYADTERAKEIIKQYEPNKFNIQKGLFSLDGFLRYVLQQQLQQQHTL